MQNFKTEVGFPLTTAKSAHETEGLMTDRDKLLSFWKEVKRKSNKNKTLKKSIIR